MKDKIELTLVAFTRWFGDDRDRFEVRDAAWQSLCAEAEKREPLEAWAVVFKGGGMAFYESKSIAEASMINNDKLIRLVEEQER